MNRDGVKTAIGLLVIGLIIVATFLYGNHQRQAQLRHDQDVKKQQETAAQATPLATPKATATPTSTVTHQASVPSPSANPLQGQGTNKTTATPVVTATVPSTGGTAATTPRTGPGELAPVALLALIGAGVYYRRSRIQLLQALVRSDRS